MGSISSDVERKMEISVPREMIPPAYRLDADAENPHCGTAPRMPPAAGPANPALAVSVDVFCAALCSMNSSNRYVKKRNGMSFAVSSMA